MKNVAIVGLGFVGLTLSVVSSKRGFNTYGIDLDKTILEGIKKGKAHFHEDGINSGMEIAKKLGCTGPWVSDNKTIKEKIYSA